MGRMKKSSPAPTTTRKLRPALTPEARENRAVSLAYDLVEKRLMEGTATSQETTLFLKIGREKEKYELELEILEKQKQLMEAKTEALQSAKRVEELYDKALKQFRIYSGQEVDEGEDYVYVDEIDY